MGRVGCVAPTLLPSLNVSVCSLRAALARQVPIIQSCQMNRTRWMAIAFYYQDKRQCGIHDNCRPAPFLHSPNTHTHSLTHRHDVNRKMIKPHEITPAALWLQACYLILVLFFFFFIKFNFKASCRIFKLHCKVGKLSENLKYV